jgi:hypothetical protein
LGHFQLVRDKVGQTRRFLFDPQSRQRSSWRP